MNPEQVEALKTLAALKAEGVLSEDEFAAEKKKLMASPPPPANPAHPGAPRAAAAADSVGGGFKVERLMRPLGIAATLMVVAMFMPWWGIGPFSLTGWNMAELADVGNVTGVHWLGVYLIPVGAGYILLRLGQGMRVNARVRVWLGLIPILLNVISMISGGMLPWEMGMVWEMMGLGHWLALVSGIIVVFNPT